MKRFLSVLLLCTVGACGEPAPGLTNDEIIVEYKKCKAAGMEANIYADSMSRIPVRVVCYVPK